MTNTFDLMTTDFLITFAYYIKAGDGFEFGPKKQIVIHDCYFDHQAEEKFWELFGQDYDGVCLFDTEEIDLTTYAEVKRMEEAAIIEHLFDTTQFGQTDQAIALKYSDTE